MNTATRLLLASIALPMFITCASSQGDAAKDVETIRTLITRDWPSAALAADIERYLNFVTEDVLILPPSQPPLRGKAEVSAFLRTAFDNATFEITIHPPEEIVVAGGWAYARYRVQMVVHPRSGGPSAAFDRKYLDIWRHGPDGKWRCHRHMWNDNPASTKVTSSDEDAMAIRRVLDQRRAAVETGDRTGWIDVWTDDARFIDPTGTDLVGRDALRSWADPFFDQFRMQYVEFVEEVVVNDDMAFARVKYDFRFTPKAGGTGTQDRGKGLLILRKEASGSWKIAQLLLAPSPPLGPAR